MKIKLLNLYEEEYVKEEKVYFNLFQTKKLSYCIKNIKYPKDFLKKFFNVKIFNNRSNYIFNFEYDKFDDINIKEFAIKMNENKYYDDKTNELEKNTNPNNETDIYSMDFDLNIIYPSISIFNKTKNGILYESEQISLNEIESYNLFYQTSIIDWPKYIIEDIIKKRNIVKIKIKNRMSGSNSFQNLDKLPINFNILNEFKNNSKEMKQKKFLSNHLKKV
jgi:hypothetical protein